MVIFFIAICYIHYNTVEVKGGGKGSESLFPGHILGRGGKRGGDNRERAGFRAARGESAGRRKALQAAPTWLRRGMGKVEQDGIAGC